MKIVVTGGAGFIGTNFVRSLISNKFQLQFDRVIVVDKLTYAGKLDNIADLVNENEIEFVNGDITNPSLIREIVEGAEFIFNFAAESHVDRSIEDATNFITTNVLGVQNICDAISKSSKKGRLIQISTDEVYGSISEGSWDEKQPLLPNSPYAASKASSDLIVRSYIKTHNLDAVITRCCNNYGPYQHPEKAIPVFINSALAGKKIPLYGSGSNVREWIHVQNHCDAIAKVAQRGASGEIYNIGSGIELTNKDLAVKILSILNLDPNYLNFIEDRKGHDLRYSIDSSKIRADLGVEIKEDFDRGLRDTVEWYVSRFL